MFEWLDNLFQKPIDSSGDLAKMKESSKKKWSPEAERKARANGFPNAAAMDAWAKQRTQKRVNNTSAPRARINAGIDAAMGMHPKSILEQVTEALNQATQKD